MSPMDICATWIRSCPLIFCDRKTLVRYIVLWLLCLISSLFVAVQASYALQRAIGHYSDDQLRRLRTHAFALFLNEADSDVVTATSAVVAGPARRRSPRSNGMHRRTLFTDEVKAIFCGITGGTRAFRHDTDVSSVQMLGMCTMLHHVLFQDTLRPHVGPWVHHGLGTLVSHAVPFSMRATLAFAVLS
jgi:hypothetical protein